MSCQVEEIRQYAYQEKPCVISASQNYCCCRDPSCWGNASITSPDKPTGYTFFARPFSMLRVLSERVYQHLPLSIGFSFRTCYPIPVKGPLLLRGHHVVLLQKGITKSLVIHLTQMYPGVSLNKNVSIRSCQCLFRNTARLLKCFHTWQRGTTLQIIILHARRTSTAHNFSFVWKILRRLGT